MLNSKKIGIKKVKGCKVVFKNVSYEPGTLGVVALDEKGKETGRSALKSAVGKTAVNLHADKKILHADGQELCFIELRLVGENGITKSSVDRKLSVEVSGAGTLQGFGSSVPNTDDSFLSGTYSTYYGKALIAVRAGYQEGDITVTVKAGGLETKTLKIQVRREKVLSDKK